MVRLGTAASFASGAPAGAIVAGSAWSMRLGGNLSIDDPQTDEAAGYRYEAGANRDFNQIHHNTPVTQAQGAPDMYANNVFIQGMWERTVREYIGLGGRFKKTGPFRMRIFNNVGETVVTKGTVKRKWVEGDDHLVELEIVSEHSRGISVGPGPVIVTLFPENVELLTVLAPPAIAPPNAKALLFPARVVMATELLEKVLPLTVKVPVL